MNWITHNISSGTRIIISSVDSGRYLAAITGMQSVSYYSYWAGYSSLMKLLTDNASDPQIVPLMLEQNISYVYIGSIAISFNSQTYYYRHFNSTHFLSSPYFDLVKQEGDAWLFEFQISPE